MALQPANVPQSQEERAAVRKELARQAKAACAAGHLIVAERILLERSNFCSRCELHDARLLQDVPPEEISTLEEAVRLSSARLKELEAAAAAAGER